MAGSGRDRESLDDFLEFAAEVLPHSYSQRFQDLWFLWETGFRRGGYFTEFGALNGRDFSNTYVLERLGWRGVIAEPHPDFETRMRANRRCTISTRCVYSRSDETISFHVVRGRPALSSVGHLTVDDDKQTLRSDYRSVPVRTISLDDLLEQSGAPGTVDCLSIDTEGSETEILAAYDFTRRPINCICVEHNDVHRAPLFALLSRAGYRRKFEAISGHDDWYVRVGAYPDWTDAGCDAVAAALGRLPPFETAAHERRAILAAARA